MNTKMLITWIIHFILLVAISLYVISLIPHQVNGGGHIQNSESVVKLSSLEYDYELSMLFSV